MSKSDLQEKIKNDVTESSDNQNPGTTYKPPLRKNISPNFGSSGATGNAQGGSSFDFDQWKQQAEERAKASVEKYHQLVAAAGNGTLLQQNQTELRNKYYDASGMDYFRRDFNAYAAIQGAGTPGLNQQWSQNIANQRDYFSRYAKYFSESDLAQFNSELDYYDSVVQQRTESLNQQGSAQNGDAKTQTYAPEVPNVPDAIDVPDSQSNMPNSRESTGGHSGSVYAPENGDYAQNLRQLDWVAAAKAGTFKANSVGGTAVGSDSSATIYTVEQGYETGTPTALTVEPQRNGSGVITGEPKNRVTDFTIYDNLSVVEHADQILATQGSVMDAANAQVETAAKNIEMVDNEIDALLQNAEYSLDAEMNPVFVNDSDHATFSYLMKQRSAYVEVGQNAIAAYDYAYSIWDYTKQTYMDYYDGARSSEEVEKEIESAKKGEISLTPNQWSQLYVEKQVAEQKEQNTSIDTAEKYIKGGGTTASAWEAYQIEDKAYRKTAAEYFDAVSALNAYVDAFIQNVQNTPEADALRQARDKDLAEGVKLSDSITYTEYTNFFAAAIELGWLDADFVPEELSRAQQLTPGYDAEKAKMDAVSNDLSAMWLYQSKKAHEDENFDTVAQPDTKKAEQFDGDFGEVYQFLKDPQSHGLSGTFEISDQELEFTDLLMLSEEERKLFFYYANSGDQKMAELLLANLASELTGRFGEYMGKKYDIPVVRVLGALGVGALKGSRAVGYGIQSIFMDIEPPDLDATDYMLGYWQEKHKNTFTGYAIDAGYNIGNMSQSVVGYMINPVVGRTMTFLNARGNAYIEAKRNGYTHGQAWVYSTLVGASETGLEVVLGAMGGIAKGWLPSKISASLGKKITSIGGRLVKDFALNSGGELIEENVQNYLEPAFAMIVGAADSYDAPDFDDFLETSIVTIMTTFAFSAAQAPSNVKQLKFDDQMGLFADAAMKADKDSDTYKEGAIIREMLDNGEHISSEYMLAVFGRLGMDTSYQLNAYAQAMYQSKGKLGDIDAKAFDPKNALQNVKDVRNAWQDARMTAVRAGDSYTINAAANAITLAQEAQENLDKALSKGLITQEEYDNASNDLQFVSNGASNLLTTAIKNQKAPSNAAQSAAQETEQRAALVQEANPNATVLTSNGTQAYLDTGVVTLKVAQDAGQVLDGIVAGEITSDSISNNQIDRLKTTQEFGRKAVSSVLGVEVKRASSASAQRAAVREAIRTFEQNNAEAQSVVATAQNQAQQSEAVLGMEFDAQNSIPLQTQQNAVSGTGAPAGSGVAVGNAQAVPQAQASAQNGEAFSGQVESNIEMSDATGTVANVHGDATTSPMSYKEFKYRMKNDKEFRNRYAPNDKNLSEEERNTIAYDTYLSQEQATTNSDRADTVQHSVKDNQYGLERNEYSEKLDQKVVSAIDALAKLFHLKIRFADLGEDNGLYHGGTGLIELDISPYHKGASNGFLFSVSHEIGHAVRARIGEEAWNEFADYAVKAMGGEKKITEKQKSNKTYSKYANAREDVVCDFIGELLSNQEMLDAFCESIKGGKIKTETARGIVAVWRKITGILRGKGVKQTDTATAALVQRVQEQFNTDIETAENAVRKMQKALSAAMKAEAQNKNATETGDVKRSRKGYEKFRWTKAERDLAYRTAEREIGSPDNYIDKNTKYLYATEKGNSVFALYGIGDGSEVTILYAVGGSAARNEQQRILDYLEGKHGTNRNWKAIDRLLAKLSDTGANESDYIPDAKRRHSNVGDVQVSERESGRNGRSDLSRGREDQQGERDGLKRSRKDNPATDKDKPRRIVPTPEEAKALDERLKAREAENEAERIRIRNESMRKLVENAPANVALRERNNIKRSAKDNLAETAEKNGRMQQGESPVRDVTVPVSTDGETKVRRTVRTAMEAEATPQEMIPHIEESIVEGNFNYKPKKNAKTMEAARAWVERRADVKKAYEDWLSEKKRRLNADMIARGFIIYNNLSNACANATTETERTELREKAISILQDISVMGTVAGQTAQAIRLLKQQSPESQYYALERAVRKLQDGINERYGDKQNDAPKIEIDKKRAARWIQALREGDMELAYDLEEVLFQQIAKQIPKTLSDRLNAWRYLSMLGNPKTLIRNAVGNAAFTPIVMAKDQIGALMEKLLQKEQRTKYFGSLHASAEGRALLKFASEDALSSDVQQMMERNKYDDTNVNDRLARAVSERRRTFDAPVLKQWQAATRYMMEKMPGMGDEFYKGIHYRRAFAGAAMARGYTVADFTSGRVSETELIKLRTYATNQAMKATFNDANKFSDLVSRLHTKSKVANTAIEGALPFKRTPANVAVRSFEYSPLAMIRSLTTDLYALKTGKITGQEYIEHLSQGVTGTVLFGLGWLAAATGIVRVGADDDDEREGRQSYSLELFGESITLDWLAPTSVAFFMGAEARELFSERDMGESFLDAAVDAGSNIFAPVLEMTALSGAKDLLDTFVYSYNKDGADAGQIVRALFFQPFLSYLGQFAPTVFGQFENMFEPYRTTTYVGDIQGKVDRTFVRNIAKILEKVPFVDWRQIEYVDDWGRKDYNGNVFLRFFNSFINPAYVNDIVVTDVDAEVRRIMQSTGTNVSPKRRGYSITVTDYDENGDEISSEKVTLSAEQFEAYQTEYGKQYALMSASLMASTYYDTLSDKEKAKAFKEIESLADEYGKIAAGVGYVLDKSSTDNKLYELVEAGMPVAEAYAARLMYTQLSKDEDLTPVERYEKFRVWVYGNEEWTDAEKTAVIERFGKFSSGFVAKSENFDEMVENDSIDADVANSINNGIRELEPEDGKDEASVYQKYDYILSRNDLDQSQKDAAILAYMGEQEAARFKPCADSGISATTYANVALRIHELKPTGGRTSVNDGQKFEVCINAVSSAKQQDALLNRYMDSDQSAKYEKARAAGVTPTMYVKYYNAKYTYGDGNGSWTQDELQRWLDANVSSRSQKATLWELTNSNWKNNPYK